MNQYLSTTTLLERLTDLRESVHRHGPEHFNMTTWGHSRTDHGHGYVYGVDHSLFQVSGLDINACGTTACLAGHLALLCNLAREDMQGLDHDYPEILLAAAINTRTTVFHRAEWGFIDLAGGATMEDRYFKYAADHEDNTAEWLTVLDYLDERIKAEAAASVGRTNPAQPEAQS